MKDFGVYPDLAKQDPLSHLKALKLVCKSKDPKAAENKNNIFYDNDCSNCKAVYFGESKWSLKSRSNEYKILVDCHKNEIAKHC